MSNLLNNPLFRDVFPNMVWLVIFSAIDTSVVDRYPFQGASIWFESIS